MKKNEEISITATFYLRFLFQFPFLGIRWLVGLAANWSFVESMKNLTHSAHSLTSRCQHSTVFEFRRPCKGQCENKLNTVCLSGTAKLARRWRGEKKCALHKRIKKIGAPRCAVPAQTKSDKNWRPMGRPIQLAQNIFVRLWLT